jgi:hypothetical protein
VNRAVAVVTGCALALPLALASAAGGASEITSIGPPTPFAVYKGTMVWSARENSGAYQMLMRKGDGDVRRLPVRTRPIPFDVDVGPTSSGGILAVYSRCDIDQAWDQHQMPDYRSGKRCDIYKLDLATGKEERFTKINSSDGSEYWPSYWKGTVAFARAYEKDPSNPNLYSKVVSSSAPSQQEKIGPRGSRSSTPLHIELYGSRIAFAWASRDQSEASAYEIRVDTIGGSSTKLDSAAASGPIALGWPSFDDGRLYWVRACIDETGSCSNARRFQQAAYSGSQQPKAAESPAYVQAHERDSGVTWSETDASASYACESDPSTPYQCLIEPLTPQFAALK